MSKKKMLPIDGDKLMGLLGRKGLDPRQVSDEIGHDRGYLQDCYRLGRIGRPETMTLEKVYGIRYADYEWVENEQKELPILAEGSPSKKEIDKDFMEELSHTLKEAVKDGFIEGFREAMKEARKEHE